MSDARLRDVVLRLRDGRVASARATGNNAAWLCPCGEDPLPLLATWFRLGSESECPACGRRYKFSKETDCVEEVG